MTHVSAIGRSQHLDPTGKSGSAIESCLRCGRASLMDEKWQLTQGICRRRIGVGDDTPGTLSLGDAWCQESRGQHKSSGQRSELDAETLHDLRPNVGCCFECSPFPACPTDCTASTWDPSHRTRCTALDRQFRRRLERCAWSCPAGYPSADLKAARSCRLARHVARWLTYSAVARDSQTRGELHDHLARKVAVLVAFTQATSTPQRIRSITH